MKKLVSLIVMMCFLSQSFADCDWTKIVKNADGTYTYSEALNLCVGKLVQANKAQTQQVADLTKAITLKDLSIQESDKRADLWFATSGKLEDRVQKMDSEEKHNEFLFFGAGVLATVLTGFMTARLIGH